MSDCKNDLTRLSSFLGKPIPANAENEVREFIDDNMWHHRTDWESELSRLTEFIEQQGYTKESNLKSEVQVLIDASLRTQNNNTKMLHMALKIYGMLLQKQFLNQQNIVLILQKTINEIHSEDKKRRREDKFNTINGYKIAAWQWKKSML